MNKNQSIGLYVFIGIILLIVIAASFMSPNTSTTEISYSQFINKVQMGTIDSVTISKDYLIAIPKDENSKDEKEQEKPKTDITNPFSINNISPESVQQQYKVRIPTDDKNAFLELLEKNNVEVEFAKPQNTGWASTILIPIIFITILVALIAKGIQQTGSSALNFGKSKAKMLLDDKIKITFKDVAGIDEERQELEEIVDFLKNSESIQNSAQKFQKEFFLSALPVQVKL